MLNYKLFSLSLVSISIILIPTVSFAVPNLQIYLDPSKPGNSSAYYDWAYESWIVENLTGSVTVTLLMTESYWNTIKSQVNSGARSIVLAIALDQGVTPSYGTLRVNGTQLTNFVYDIPPFPKDAYNDPDTLPPHGFYPTYYTQYDLKSIVEALTINDRKTIYDTQPGGDGSTLGYAIDLAISVTDFSHIHFDFYSYNTADGSIGGGNFAPFSHDAEYFLQDQTKPVPPPPIPEPHTIILFSSGLLAAIWFGRRKR